MMMMVVVFVVAVAVVLLLKMGFMMLLLLNTRRQSTTKVKIPGGERRQSRALKSEEINKFDKDVKELFRVFDKDGDGTISTEEMGKALKTLGVPLTYQELRMAAKSIDKDSTCIICVKETCNTENGKIDFSEFRGFIRKQFRQKDIETHAWETFRLFDKDGNGSIDRKELTHAMKSLGEECTEEDISEMLNDADADGDGKINFDGSI
ncbi:neo-calmodulin-like [Mya arenaria]|uniref:neo-calmodulin-like n=1 Tax=Mya arenaria TaxID=6604 RepID=UPI0022E6A83D|nr:neo-calmodulin-like [Mya arenaria]